MVLGRLDSYMQKNQAELLSNISSKNKSKMLYILSVRSETIKVLEENMGSMLFHLVLTIFWGIYLLRQG